MKKVQRAALAFLQLSLLAAPLPVLAFESVDSIPWPSSGVFPAYAYDPVRPTGITLRAGMMYDNNIVRRETNPESDFVTRAGVGFRHDQRVIGRQRLIVDARGDGYLFNEFNDLNHIAYAALADWRWEIGNDLSGSILVARDRRQSDLAETRTPVSDLVTATRFGATAGYMLTPSTRLHGGVTNATAERTREAETETSAATWTAGADYVSPLANRVGLEYRRTVGDAPVPEFVAPAGTFVNNDFREEEIALTVAYTSLVQFRLVGRIGRTTREYSQLSDRNFEGATGRFAIEWLPGNKTILGFEAYKVPQSVIEVSAGHLLIRGVAFTPRWAVTNKLVLSARFARERRTFEGLADVALGAEPLRDEYTTLMRFGVGWEPQRHWQVGFGLDRGERESNTFDRDYQFTALVANVTWIY